MAAPPANDSVTSPTVLGAVPVTASAETAEATADPSDGGCGGEGDRATVWYSFTAGDDGRIRVGTAGSSYRTGLSVFRTVGGERVLVGCGVGDVTLYGDPGEPYLLLVSALGGPGGTLSLQVAGPPPPVQIGLAVSRTGRYTRSGDATVRGTVTCDRPEPRLWLEVRLRQRAGRLVITGYGTGPVACGPDRPAPWQVRVSSDNGIYRGEPARATAFAITCDDFEYCSERTATRTVRLLGPRRGAG